MNEQPRHPTEGLEQEIAREAALAYIPARPGAKQAVAEAKTFADLVDDASGGTAKLLVAMDDAEAALKLIEAAATAILEKAKHARPLIEAVRASAQR